MIYQLGMDNVAGAARIELQRFRELRRRMRRITNAGVAVEFDAKTQRDEFLQPTRSRHFAAKRFTNAATPSIR